MTRRWIYFFGNGHADGNGDARHLIGGKGASLADMTRAGLNVPPGFTISTECCAHYYQHNQRWPDDLDAELRANLERLEKLAGRRFGVGATPLLVAVRSGAAQSMPGMMDTVLNVGLNPECVAAMAERTGNAHGAWEAYLHFILMYAHTVGGIDNDVLDSIAKPKDGEPPGSAELETLCARLRDFYADKTGAEFPTHPWTMLCASINAVFQSWNSDRAITYRKHHKIDGLLGTAVNVQMMCPSEVSGVMFTANPVNQAPEIIIESAYGLGEAIVLGKVTPDRFVLHKNDLSVKETVISRKETRVATLAEDGKGQTGAIDEASLTPDQVRLLAQLGQRVESYFSHPCDVEWAISRGEFYLLQTRPIKFKGAAAIDPAERERVRREEIANLKALAEPGGTVWSRFNLAEILPEPTPMTWSIVRRFMSGRGGFGQMYRDLGFDPDPALDDVGMFDLICGRPYCNLSHEPRMQYQNLPFEHRFEDLKKDPSKALYPQATLNPRRAGLMFFVKVPLLFLKMWWSQIQQKQLTDSFADDFTKEIVPKYLAEIERGNREDWNKLSSKEVLDRLNDWIQLTLFDFARHSLKPTALAALLLANLERAFAARLQPADLPPPAAAAVGMQKAQAALRELVMGVHPDEHTDLPSAIRALREHRLSREDFLTRFGHRGSQEMELARPRWAEDPTVIDAFVGDVPSDGEPSIERSVDAWQLAWLKLADEAKLLPSQQPGVEAELRRLQRYMGLRETAKHHLLRGYAFIRKALLELDRRYGLNDGIFFLTLDELPELVNLAEGKAPQMYFERIEMNRRRREIALSLPAPTVIFSDDLDAIGRQMSHESGGTMQGVPLSAGVVEAVAWVLEDVAGARMPHEPYIL
ncbi:MAG TPA: PEP/pyruvate-binding domain-containing protein, partial [Gemmataceae bacterium]|nr:PEP/pyruvate-binding domain-containing protein [Gemmataceae bacterium]